MSQPHPPLKYKRVLLELSGPILAGTGTSHHGLDFEVVDHICDEIAECARLGLQIAIVVGGSNFWHATKDLKNLPNTAHSIEKTLSDQMGLLATNINALALSDLLKRKDVDVRVLSAIDIHGIAELYIKGRADRHLKKGRIVIISGGIGSTRFSTDTAAILHANELNADIVLISKDSAAISALRAQTNTAQHRAITYDKLLATHADIIDKTAISLANDNNITTLLFSPAEPGNILRAANGEVVGTPLYRHS